MTLARFLKSTLLMMTLLAACAPVDPPLTPSSYSGAAFPSRASVRLIATASDANRIDNREAGVGLMVFQVGICLVSRCDGDDVLNGVTASAIVGGQTTNGLLDRGGSATFRPTAASARAEVYLAQRIANRMQDQVVLARTVGAEFARAVPMMNAALTQGRATAEQIGPWVRRDMNSQAAVAHLLTLARARQAGLVQSIAIHRSAGFDMATGQAALAEIDGSIAALDGVGKAFAAGIAQLAAPIRRAVPARPAIDFPPLPR